MKEGIDKSVSLNASCIVISPSMVLFVRNEIGGFRHEFEYSLAIYEWINASYESNANRISVLEFCQTINAKFCHLSVIKRITN